MKRRDVDPMQPVIYVRETESKTTSKDTTAKRRPRTPRSTWLAYIVVGLTFAAVIGSFAAVIYYRILPQRADRRARQALMPQTASDLPLSLSEPAPTVDATARVDWGRAAAKPEQAPMTVDDSPPIATALPSDPSEATIPAVQAQPTTSERLPEDSSVPPSRLRELNRADRARLYGWLVEVQQAIRQRPPTDTAQQLAAAKQLAGGTSYDEQVERLATLADYVQQFWQAFDDGLRELAGRDLVIGPGRVHVVDVTDAMLIVKDLGRQKRFAIEALPSRYVLAIADRWLDPGAASTGVFRGAYMLVTDGFTKDDVRRMWQTAADQGADLDDLMMILDDTYEGLIQ